MTDIPHIEETELDEDNVYSVPEQPRQQLEIDIRAQEERRYAPPPHRNPEVNQTETGTRRRENRLVVERSTLVHPTFVPCPAYSEISTSRERTELETEALEVALRISQTQNRTKDLVNQVANLTTAIHIGVQAEKLETIKLRKISLKSFHAAILLWIVYMLTQGIFLLADVTLNKKKCDCNKEE
jgi:hypothetical protein